GGLFVVLCSVPAQGARVLLAVEALTATVGPVSLIPEGAEDDGPAGAVGEVAHQHLVSDLRSPVFPGQEGDFRRGAAVLIVVGHPCGAVREVVTGDPADTQELLLVHGPPPFLPP